MKELKDQWTTSPITKREEVLVDNDGKNGISKMCIGSGFFTNENPLNYKKNPDFDINRYEKNMPQLMKDLRFDDGESYWYPTTIRTSEGMLFPSGESKDSWKWAVAPIVKLSKKEVKDSNGEYVEKIDMKKAKFFNRFIEASKEMNGVTLDELS